MPHGEDTPSAAESQTTTIRSAKHRHVAALMRRVSGFFARRRLSPHLSLAACRCSLQPDRGCLTFSLRMRAVWRHAVFMTRVIHAKNGIDTLYTLRTSRSSGDAVLTNEKLPRVASRRREVLFLLHTVYRGFLKVPRVNLILKKAVSACWLAPAPVALLQEGRRGVIRGAFTSENRVHFGGPRSFTSEDRTWLRRWFWSAEPGVLA